MPPSAAALSRRLPVVAVPECAGIRLHLADPRSGLGRLLRRYEAGPPYWAHLWAGGLVLARAILADPALVAGRSALDLGCGSGLVGIAAARAGAAGVQAIDSDPLAVAATALNAALNGVSIEARCTDVLDGPAPAGMLVLVGDLFYAPDLARRVEAFLDRCVGAGCDVLVGDPGRLSLPRDALRRLATLPVPDFGSGRDDVTATLYRFEGRAVPALSPVDGPCSGS